MNPNIMSFFKELIQRISTRSPVFFKILQFFAAGLTFAGYIPSMLQRWLNIEVPGHIITLCEDVAHYATGFFAASSLTAASPAVALKENGEILKQTDEKRLPFTKQCEEKAKEKLTDVPLVAEVVAIKEEESSDNKEVEE